MIDRCPVCGRVPDLYHSGDRRVVYIRCRDCQLGTWRPYGPKKDTAISACTRVVLEDWHDICVRMLRWKGGEA